MTTFKKITTSYLASAILLTGMATSNQAKAAGITHKEAAIIAGAGGVFSVHCWEAVIAAITRPLSIMKTLGRHMFRAA